MQSSALQLYPLNASENEQSLSNQIIQGYKKNLAIYSSDDFYAEKWDVKLVAARREGTLHFSDYHTQLESDITRITVLTMLSAGMMLNSCQRRIRDYMAIFEFLKANGITLPQITQNTVNAFIRHLDKTAYEPWKRNQYIRSLQTLAEMCCAYDVVRLPSTFDFTFRFSEAREPKRAPDSIVVAQLDRLFFDAAVDIPNSYRAIYILLRLHTHRISEVLATPLDCISYPDYNVFAISIPTSKETPRHIPVFTKYNYLLSGFCGGFCHHTIYEQYQYATSVQSKIPDAIKDYLFITGDKPHLITTAEFNSFLSTFCTDHKIENADGKPVAITSHDFRHINVCERLKGNIISIERTSIECNHSTTEETMGYGVYSKHDETQHLAEIVKPLFDSEPKKKGRPRKVTLRKFAMLAQQASTRVIPYYGLCLNHDCSPQFEKCFHCTLFIPDPQYKDYILEAITRLEKANELIAKKHGDTKTMQENIKTIHLYNAYLKKLDNLSENKKASDIG